MLLYLEFLPSLVVGMARIYPCAFLVAAFCFQHIRGMPRHTIVMVMALMPAPGIHAALEGLDYSALMLSALVLKEIALGLLLGVLLSMPFWMFESVGALLDNQRGALAGGQLNPSLGPDATPVGHLFKQLAIFLLMVTLGLGALTQVIWDSYRIWPPTAWFPLPAANGMSLFVDLLGDTFTHMMLYAAPFIAVLLLLEFGIALLTQVEVVKEYKDMEGDPHVKGQRRSLAYQLAQEEPKVKLPKLEEADMLVVNPTHFAVALYYRPGKTPLPLLVDKGTDAGARRLIARAKAADVPVIQCVWLARTLYTKKRGANIPRETLQAVALIYRTLRELDDEAKRETLQLPELDQR